MSDPKAALTETLREALASEHPFNGGTFPRWFRVWINEASEKAADALLGLPGVAVVDAEVYRVARKGLVDLTEAWAELRMDTPEDQSLHDRLVALSRVAADLLPLPKAAAAVVVSEGETR